MKFNIVYASGKKPKTVTCAMSSIKQLEEFSKKHKWNLVLVFKEEHRGLWFRVPKALPTIVVYDDYIE